MDEDPTLVKRYVSDDAVFKSGSIKTLTSFPSSHPQCHSRAAFTLLATLRTSRCWSSQTGWAPYTVYLLPGHSDSRVDWQVLCGLLRAGSHIESITDEVKCIHRMTDHRRSSLSIQVWEEL